MMNMNNLESVMPSTRVSALTKEDIAAAARNFRWNRQMPKWTVIVEGRELPARPLVLEAARVPPNDPTNSHQAVAILQEQGFDVRYQGTTIREENDKKKPAAEFELILRKIRGSCKGKDSLVGARQREHTDDNY